MVAAADVYIFFCQDDNRYSAGKGAHRNLKRAEKHGFWPAKCHVSVYLIYYLKKIRFRSVEIHGNDYRAVSTIVLQKCSFNFSSLSCL